MPCSLSASSRSSPPASRSPSAPSVRPWRKGGRVAQALAAIAQQPDEAATLSRILFVGVAMIESTAIYCLVISMILIFANPFWNHFVTLTAR